MASRKLRNGLNKSDRSEKSFISGETESEHFWSIELNAEKRSFTWTVNEDLEDDDEDFVDHTLFIRQAVLGAGAVPEEQNVVTLESVGTEGEKVKGTIINLKSDVNSMCPLELTIPGKSGATFTLTDGSGPLFINGAHLLEFPKEDLDMINNTQTESELSEDLQDEEDEESEVELKTAKRKAAKMTNGKEKQKAKMEVEDDEDDDEEDDEDEEDFEDEDEEEEVESPKAKGKKKAQETKAKAIVKEVPQKYGKTTKKVKAAKK